MDCAASYGSSFINPIGYGTSWGFERNEDLKEKEYNYIIRMDILISHSPPFGVMDEENYGCKPLLNLVNRIKPKIHAFGHCHEGYGVKGINGTLFVNASSCNRQYVPVNKPIVIDFDPLTKEYEIISSF